MAQDKKSFLLYTDLKYTVEKLTNEQAGRLFKHILSYVNDENPQTDDIIIQLVFEPIRQQMKRDLKSWEVKREKRSNAGKVGGLKSGKSRKQKTIEAKGSNASKSKQEEAKGSKRLHDKTKEANEAVTVNANVNVTDTVNVNDTVIGNVKDKLIKDKMGKKEKLDAAKAATLIRRKKFHDLLIPFIDIYSKEMITKFYNYWAELNISETKMRKDYQKTWELKRRLITWSNNNGKFSKNGTKQNSKSTNSDSNVSPEFKKAILNTLLGVGSDGKMPKA